MARLPDLHSELGGTATCPESCRHWRSCYGNHMQWLQRMEAGPDLEWKLEREVALLSIDHPNFVVRLARRWRLLQRATTSRCGGKLLERHEGLSVFGYTARTDDDIADALRSLARDAGWSRFAMRFSNSGEPTRSTVTIESVRQKPVGAVVCPEQIGRTESCSTCALCWSSERPVAFLQH